MKPNRVEQLAEETRLLSGKLKPLMAELGAIMQDDSLRSGQNQLEAVQKSIKSLETAGVPVPGELIARQLDLKERVKVFDVAEKAMDQIAELLHALPSSMKNCRSPKNRSRQGRASQGRVALQNLFDVGLLHDGEELIHEETRTGAIHRGRFRAPGLIEMKSDGHTRTFPTPSAAAAVAAGTGTCNGWVYWSVMTSEGPVLLDEYRKKYREATQHA
jgi:hypothetical protein